MMEVMTMELSCLHLIQLPVGSNFFIFCRAEIRQSAVAKFEFAKSLLLKTGCHHILVNQAKKS